jgi:hypothetical protein
MPQVTHVLAACAAVCYLKGDDGSETVSALLSDERNTVAIHQVTLVELCAKCEMADGPELAEKAWAGCSDVMRVEEPTTASFAKRTARWLARGSITLAQAYAGATAEEYHATLVVYADGALGDAALATGIKVLAVEPARSSASEVPVSKSSSVQASMTRESPTSAPRVKLVPLPTALEPKKDSLADKVERLDLGF